MRPFHTLPLKKFRKHTAYFLDDVLVVLNLRNQSLHALDQLSAWLFLSIDDGKPKQLLRQQLQKELIPAEQIKQVFQKLEELIEPTDALKCYMSGLV